MGGGHHRETALSTICGVTARLKRTVAERPATRSTVALHLKRLWSGLGLGLCVVGLGLGVVGLGLGEVG